MPSENFYRINFEKEISVQGRTTLFLSIEANEDAGPWLSNESLFVAPIVQPQTFESKFEGWNYITAQQSEPKIIYFQQGYFAKTGAEFSQASWDAIELGDDIKSATMYRRTLNGETAAGNGSIRLVPFTTTVVDKGVKQIPAAGGGWETVYYIEASQDFSTPAQIGENFLVQIGKWKTDDNWYINQTKASEVAQYTLKNEGSLIYDFPELAPNQFDGQDYANDWPRYANYITRFTSGILNPWSSFTGGIGKSPRLTFRIDYDGEANAHLKINFLIVYTDTNNEDPSNFDPATITALAGSLPVYGQKLPTLNDRVDYQEVHLFGYTETTNRTNRTTYQNAYPTLGKEIYDDLSSYGVLKTNPKLTGNIKLTIDSNGDLSLNTIDASQELSDAKYKKYPVSSNTSYQRDLYYFLNRGTFPADVLYKLHQIDDQYLNTKRTYAEQYDNFYNYGVEQLKSKFYDEDFSFFAPIWLRKVVPDFFVIFRVDHPINPLSYTDVTNSDKFQEFFKDSRIIKTFDMRESSPLGTYLRKIVEDNRFQERPLQVSFDKDIPTTWFGFDYASGTITGKGEFLYDFWNSDNRILDFEETITGGFERNKILSSNLINLEFLFNDDEATPYTINRYYGFYVTENQLAEFEIEPTVLGSIPGQSPLPKLGVDGEPYNMQPFFQTNANGVQLPVDYYHNLSGVTNSSSTPEYTGLVNGKFALPSMVEDSLRFFYVKDRNGILKRVNELSEVDYGNPGSPDYKRVTQLRLFDSYENISDYGGLTQLASQYKTELLDSGNAQTVVYLEDILQSGEPLADGETIDIILRKLNTERRDYYYRLVVTSVAGGIVDIDVFVPDYAGLTPTIPDLFLTDFTIDVSALTVPEFEFFVDSYLRGTVPNNQPVFTVGCTWEVHIENGNIVSANLIVGSTTADITFFGTPNYVSYRWRMEANPIGLLPGEAWDYPVLDPLNRDFTNHFCNNGTPTQVAKALALCINTFDNKIVEAYAKGDAIYIKSLKKYEDGNSISIVRNYINKLSVPRNFGYYEKCNVDRGTYAVQLVSPSGPPPGITIKNTEFDPIYNNIDNYIAILPVPLGNPTAWNVTIRTGVDPANPTITGAVEYYFVSGGNTTLELPAITLDLTPVVSSFSSLTYESWSKGFSEQYFIGGVKRKRARAKLTVSDGQRYYQNRKITLSADLTSGSKIITNLSSTSGLYVGAPFSGKGILKNSRILEISEITNSIVISNPALATAANNKFSVGELSILNDSLIYQQWFQIQKGNYSRLKACDVQGKLVYSLPYMDAKNLQGFDTYSIVQIGRNNTEFYLTADKRIIAYQVYRPAFGILSLFPIKTFDVDTYFSEYSYAPTIELLRYFNREETSGNTDPISTNANNGNVNTTPLPLNIGENYEFTLNIDNYTGAAGDYVFVEFDIDVYDSNDKSWKYVDTVSSKIACDPNANILLNNPLPYVATDLQINGLKTVMFNTYYPVYFYDNMEVPHDYDPNRINVPVPGPYNVANIQPVDPASGLPIGDQINLGPQYTAAGTRNYVRKLLYTNGSTEGNFTKARISKIAFYDSQSYATAPGPLSIVPNFEYTIKVQSANYYIDTNIQRFAGFSTLADFVTDNDIQLIQNLQSEQSFDKFTFQMLLSEYDRLRENSQKDLAVRSKVVPYILKWVQEGTDARDNYYRLNNSSAFGITNFSPDPEVDFTEPLLLTHEFPYLDNVPKDYPEESLEGSRSYFFQKLSDVAYDGKTWYELLTLDNTDDWFSKYFVVGYPNEISNSGDLVPKSREERYTFFHYVNGLDLSQTLFRGAKINVVDYDTTVTPKETIKESTRFNEYRFAAIARFVAHHNFAEEKPIQIEVIDNKKYKTILVVITIFEQDYRLAAGLGDYSFFYYAIDQLRNSMQTQSTGGYGSASSFFVERPVSLPTVLGGTTPDVKYPMEMPYTIDRSIMNDFLDAGAYIASPPNEYASSVPQAIGIGRKRQLFLGAGRIELDDTKLGGKVWVAGKTSNLPGTVNEIKIVFQPLAASDGTSAYPLSDNSINYFPIYKEVFPTIDSYRSLIDYYLGGNDDTDLTGYPLFVNVAALPPLLSDYPFDVSSMTIDGTLSEISVSSKRNLLGVRYAGTQNIYDNRSQPDDIRLDYIVFQSGDFYQRYQNPANADKVRAIANVSLPYAQMPVSLGIYPPYSNFTPGLNITIAAIYKTDQTFNLRGGSLFYQLRKNFISYANIYKMFNEQSNYILYRTIDANGASVPIASDFELRFVSFDRLKKNSKIYYKDDLDKPLEYQNFDFVGFDTTKTNEQEYEFRHRGLHEPKTTEVISFWTREDENFTKHFEKDYLLRNTHINGNSKVGGVIRNYSYNKISNEEILRISRTSSYKSLYPFIGEIAIDHRNLNALDSTWDADYYQQYSSTQDYVNIAGTEEMQESKVFLGGKAMIVPKTFDLGTFLNSEATFEVIEPKKSIGVSSLSKKSNENNALQSKPILKINLDLKARLKRALLEGILAADSFDEFAWFNSLGIPAITYTQAKLNNLKAEYIEKNIVSLYQVDSIKVYSNSKEGLPLLDIQLTESEKLLSGYKLDNNVKTTSTSDYTFILEKELDTKAANAYSLSAVLKRI